MHKRQESFSFIGLLITLVIILVLFLLASKIYLRISSPVISKTKENSSYTSVLNEAKSKIKNINKITTQRQKILEE